jgi:NAD(P)H dehydrogenase (quinone)
MATLSMARAIGNHNKWVSAAGDGAFAPVSKRDVARCLVRCVRDIERHHKVTYEMSGPELVTMRQLVALASEVTGIDFEYVPVDREERIEMLARVLPAHQRAERDYTFTEIAEAEVAIRNDLWAVLTRHIKLICGVEPTPLREVFKAHSGQDYRDL